MPLRVIIASCLSYVKYSDSGNGEKLVLYIICRTYGHEICANGGKQVSYVCIKCHSEQSGR